MCSLLLIVGAGCVIWKSSHTIGGRYIYMAEKFDKSEYVPEILWSQIYHDTIIDSEWLLDKAVSPGGPHRWAVGYNFLYALYRILDEMHPKNVLEMGLESTKLTGQYARYFSAGHTVVEHDKEWTKFYLHGWKKLSGQTGVFQIRLI